MKLFSRANRKQPNFSLRTLFAATTFLSLFVFWYSCQLEITEVESKAVHEINQSGGSVVFARSYLTGIRSARVAVLRQQNNNLNLEVLSSLENLKGLTLRDFDLNTPEAIQSLLSCPNITSLSICDCSISTEFLAELVSKLKLENIMLHGDNIADGHLVALEKSRAKSLFLSSTSATDKGMLSIRQLNGLIRVHLQYNTDITRAGYTALSEAQSIKELTILHKK